MKLFAAAFVILSVMSFNKAPYSVHHNNTKFKTYKISSKNGYFLVSEKQKLIRDTVPDGKKVFLDTLLRNATDTIPLKDSSATKGKADTLPYRLSKNALTAPVEFYAEDSMVINIPERSAALFGKESNLLYLENDITAPRILYDMNTGDISAAMVLDSTGRVMERPAFKSGDLTTESDSFKFNMKTGKGLTKGSYTQQGEMYVYGESIKKVDDEVLFAFKGRFTTCNLDTPHFAFAFNKTKFINKKMAVTGPIHPEVEGVPIPIYLPFGIYPLQEGRHSGLLAPNFVTNEQRGLGLEGLGYYKVIGEYWDVVLQTSIYSYGGWSVMLNPRYSKRYRYSGGISLDIQHFNFNFKGDPDFASNRSWNLRWNHSADAKSRPGVTFSANVNAGSSSYNSFVPNNPMLNISNMMSSSIRYGKTWKGTPFNLTVAANHRQNTNLKQIAIDLPNLNFTMSTIYPFRKKERVGEMKWYENIGFGYNLDTRSTATFYDTVANKSIFQQIKDTFMWGAKHRIPISLSLPPLGFFQFSPSVSYDETWFQTKSIHFYNATGDTLQTRLEKGLYTARQMSFGLSASTRIFGLLMAKKKDARIVGIRHELRPTITASYRPDFQKNNYYYLTDTLGRRTQYAYYESRYNLNSLYSPGRFGGLNFSIENNVSMKVRSKKDTGEAAIKKVSLIDALSISGSYNFLQDSLKFSPLSISASSNLFDKFSVTGFASMNLYQVNDSGRTINRLVWKDRPLSLGRLTSAGLTISSSFQGGNKETGEDPGLKSTGYRPESGYSLDEYNQEMAYIDAHPGEYADFNIPWSLNFSYSLTVNRQFLMNYGFKSTVMQNLNLGGTLNLTPKWQLGVQTFYNITDGSLNPMTLSLSRDLHCWQMSIAVSSGRYRYFSINISPKAPILRDLRVNKTESFRRL
ncbi:MAG: LPS-assembly protein LptD [Chitinophagaceae bacterium]|nr:LPS-assembly protein LptD [Chitinophagaceae bacterium]